MKILQINKFYYLRGGCERYVFELSKILEKNGHRVIPFSMQDSRNWDTEYNKYFIDKVDLDKFSFKNIIKFFYNYEAVIKLEELIKREKPDIAHLHNIAHQLSPAIINVLKKHNIPIAQTLHDYKLICPNYRLYSKNKVCHKCIGAKYYNCFFRKCVKNSYLKSFLGMLEAYLHNNILKTYDLIDIFIAPSRFMKDTCVKFGISDKKIKVLKHFVDDKYFSVNSETEDYLLYFGRIAKEKGIDVLLNSIKIIDKGVKLKIIGAGPDFKNYKSQIQNLKLSEKVELIGPKHGDELINFIKKAKAIIMPSVWPENMPYSLLEAMAIGKTVITSQIGGMTELIKNNENGFLFKAGDSEELARVIKNLDNHDLKKVGERARISIKNLNSQKHYIGLLENYKKLIQ